jgi:hypothetical protein
MLHHSQQAFCEQAFRSVPQENLSFVEQAEKPVAEMKQDVRYNEVNPTLRWIQPENYWFNSGQYCQLSTVNCFIGGLWHYY